MRLRVVRREEAIGHGAEAFARARAMLFSFRFYPPEIVHAEARVAPGVIVQQDLRAGPLRFRGPSRILDVWDEPRNAGFRYEALTGHVERGIARFEVSLVGEEVRFSVRSDSAPAHWFARLGAPYARWLQRRAVDGAFRRMRAACAGT